MGRTSATLLGVTLLGALTACSLAAVAGPRSVYDLQDDHALQSLDEPQSEKFIFKKKKKNSDLTADSIRFELYTSAGDKGSRLKASDSSYADSNYDKSLDTAILIHGWMPGGRDDGWWINEMKDALFAKKNYNVIVVDWVDANSMSYESSAANAAFVGEQLSILFKAMRSSSKGIENDMLHLIGYDIGAHIAGIAGIYYPNIGRITGLSPSGPFFEGLDVDSRLDCDDAVFVDTIHTDTAGFGYSGDCGDVDIYFNGGESQPGAAAASAFLPISLMFGGVNSIGESHYRSVEYFLESVKSDTDIKVYKADSYAEFLKGDSFEEDFVFGLDMDTAARGYMFAITQAGSAAGSGSSGSGGSGSGGSGGTGSSGSSGSGSGYLSSNYVRITANTASSRLMGTMVMKIRGKDYGKVVETEMIADGGLKNVFAGDVYSMINLPDGAAVMDYGYQLAYRNNFFGGNSFNVNSVTFEQVGGAASGTYSHCDEFTIENICTAECSYALDLRTESC